MWWENTRHETHRPIYMAPTLAGYDSMKAKSHLYKLCFRGDTYWRQVEEENVTSYLVILKVSLL